MLAVFVNHNNLSFRWFWTDPLLEPEGWDLVGIPKSSGKAGLTQPAAVTTWASTGVT